MTTDVTYYVDSRGNDCYRIRLSNGVQSIVSSAHLIEERITQLLRAHSA